MEHEPRVLWDFYKNPLGISVFCTMQKQEILCMCKKTIIFIDKWFGMV